MAKRYTQAEWTKMQSRLPKEDRLPYSKSPDLPEAPAPKPSSAAAAAGLTFGAGAATPTPAPASPASVRAKEEADKAIAPTPPATTTVDERTKLQEKGVVPTPAVTEAVPLSEDPYYKIDPKTGLSQAQIDARAAIAAAKEGQVGVPAGEEDAFRAIPFDLLPDSMKKVIEVNAAARGITAKQYYDSRGGVNASGYYGDSYTPGKTLNDIEYSAAVQSALDAGAEGVGFGATINIASAVKEYNYDVDSGVDPEQAKTKLEGAITSNQDMLKNVDYTGLLGDISDVVNVPEEIKATIVTPSGPEAGQSMLAEIQDFNQPRGGAPIDVTGGVTTGVTTAPTTIATTAATGGAITGVTTAATIATVPAALTPERQGIFDVLSDRFSKYGLSSLVPRIKDLIMSGATEDTITIQLQESPEYQRRFRANAERVKKGLRVLSPAEYLNAEDGYRQVLRAYGLNQFDTDDYVSQFIQNDVSTAELSNRVVNAVQRVRNADPAISKTLRDFYGIGDTDLVAYVLDPNQQLPKIERQIAAAEIGTMARRQGIETGAAVAEQLAAQGISQAEAQKGYATIADILPTAEKLSDIYGGVEEAYRLPEAEQEVFNQLASAQRKRQRLAQREIAAFSGQTGMTRASLGSETKGQF